MDRIKKLEIFTVYLSCPSCHPAVYFSKIVFNALSPGSSEL